MCVEFKSWYHSIIFCVIVLCFVLVYDDTKHKKWINFIKNLYKSFGSLIQKPIKRSITGITLNSGLITYTRFIMLSLLCVYYTPYYTRHMPSYTEMCTNDFSRVWKGVPCQISVNCGTYSFFIRQLASSILIFCIPSIPFFLFVFMNLFLSILFYFSF